MFPLLRSEPIVPFIALLGGALQTDVRILRESSAPCGDCSSHMREQDFPDHWCRLLKWGVYVPGVIPLQVFVFHSINILLIRRPQIIRR